MEEQDDDRMDAFAKLYRAAADKVERMKEMKGSDVNDENMEVIFRKVQKEVDG